MHNWKATNFFLCLRLPKASDCCYFVVGGTDIMFADLEIKYYQQIIRNTSISSMKDDAPLECTILIDHSSQSVPSIPVCSMLNCEQYSTWSLSGVSMIYNSYICPTSAFALLLELELLSWTSASRNRLLLPVLLDHRHRPSLYPQWM